MSRRIPLIAGGLVLVMFIGWYVALWRPGEAHLRVAHAAQAAALTKQEQLTGELAGLLAIQRKLPTLEGQLRSSEPALPTSVSVDTVIDQINATAVADKIAWTNESQSAGSQTAGSAATAGASGSTGTTPSSAPSGAGTAQTLALTLTVAGTYPDMMRFVTDLEHRPRLIVLDSLAYTPGSGDQVAVQISARAFYDTSTLPALPTPTRAG
jgi:Tfp pilus assembly protein PilO